MDLRGQGASDVREQDYAMPFLRRTSPGYAHSMGGNAAQTFAALKVGSPVPSMPENNYNL